MQQHENDVGLDHCNDYFGTSASGRRSVEGSLVIDAIPRSSPNDPPLYYVRTADFFPTVDSLVGTVWSDGSVVL